MPNIGPLEIAIVLAHDDLEGPLKHPIPLL